MGETSGVEAEQAGPGVLCHTCGDTHMRREGDTASHMCGRCGAAYDVKWAEYELARRKGLYDRTAEVPAGGLIGSESSAYVRAPCGVDVEMGVRNGDRSAYVYLTPRQARELAHQLIAHAHACEVCCV